MANALQALREKMMHTGATIQASLHTASAGSISGLDPAGLALIADVSHWNGEIDLEQMQVDMLWIKAGDGKQVQGGPASDLGNYVDEQLYSNVQKAWNKKIPCGLYVYVQWNILPGTSNHGIALHHYRVLKRAIGSLIPGKSFHALALDVEERGNTAPNMAEIALTLWKMIADDPALGELPLYLYTSISVLNEYVNLREQISWKGANYNGKPYLLWLAQWAWSATPRITTTWEELRSKYLNPLVMRVLTPGYAAWNMVQVAANFKLPGCAVSSLDLSFYKGSREALYAELGYTAPADQEDPADQGEPDEPADPDLQARVEKLEAWARSVKFAAFE